MNVGHPLCRAAYEGAGGGAEMLSARGDFAEVGEGNLFK